MDYIKNHNTYLPFFILIMSSTCHALFDRFLDEDFPDEFLPHPLDNDSHFPSCDFESPCLWTLSNSSRSDWLLVSPQQPQSTKAGMMPATDNSEGRSDGHFLLLTPSPEAEASGKCDYHLMSPVLPKSSMDCLLQVAVYEAGPVVGNLTLLIKPAQPESDVHSEMLHHRGGDDRRPEWQIFGVPIGWMAGPFQVTLLYTSCEREATVALDSLEFINCESEHHFGEMSPICEESFHCNHSGDCIATSQVCNFHTDCPYGEDEGFICDALPFGSYCSFDGDSCGWSMSNQHSGWRRVAGDELTKRKDMQGFALQRTQGHFLFLPVRESNSLKEAFVQSSAFPRPVSSVACQMHFSLYLRGHFNGSLQVAIEENGTVAAVPVWERNGQAEDNWEPVALELTDLHHGFRVKVTAVWGQGSNADVALDDIALGAACFQSDLNFLLPATDFEDFLSPLPEPLASEVSLMTWWFTSCGASGPQGPTQAQCDSTYRNKNINVTVRKEGHLKGIQTWKVPATNRYLISAYGAAGGKGAKNHNKRNHGVFISAIFPLEKGDMLYILVGHQGEDACPGRNPHTQKICLGESSVIEDNLKLQAGVEWAGGGGGGGGAT